MQTHITEKSPSLTKHLTALSQNYDSKHTVYILKDHNNNTASAFSAIHINADVPPLKFLLMNVSKGFLTYAPNINYLTSRVILANDTHANMLVNSLIRKHGSLPDDYRIVGFNNSPISSEAVIPASRVSRQINKIASTAMELLVAQMKERKKRKSVPWETVIHKFIPPVLIPRETSDPFKFIQ